MTAFLAGLCGRVCGQQGGQWLPEAMQLEGPGSERTLGPS